MNDSIQGELGKGTTPTWPWPLQIERYDRTSSLYVGEREALRALASLADPISDPGLLERLDRLTRPLSDALAVMRSIPQWSRHCRAILRALIREMHNRQTSFWGWSRSDLADIFCRDKQTFLHRHKVQNRQLLLAVVYLLCDLRDIYTVTTFYPFGLARTVFGTDVVDESAEQVIYELDRRNYTEYVCNKVRKALSIAFLFNRSPYLADLTTEVLDELRRKTDDTPLREGIFTLSDVLSKMNLIAQPLPRALNESTPQIQKYRDVWEGVPARWAEWCQRWYEERVRLAYEEIQNNYTSGQEENLLGSASQKERTALYLRYVRNQLLMVGLWLARECPDVTEPDHWDRRVAAKFVGALMNLTIGDWCHPGPGQTRRIGQEAAPDTKLGYLRRIKAFLADLHQWGWIVCF